MAKVATVKEYTAWVCDRCGKMTKTVNAFTAPDAWWVVSIERIIAERHMRQENRDGDFCSKACALEGVQFNTFSATVEKDLGDRRLGEWPEAPL